MGRKTPMRVPICGANRLSRPELSHRFTRVNSRGFRRLIRCFWGLQLGLMMGCVLPARRVRPPPTPAPPPPKVVPTWFGPQGTPTEDAKSVETAPEKSNRMVPRPRWDRPRENERSPLGTNLSSPSIHSRDWVFLNVFKMSTAWVSKYSFRAETDDRKLELDEWGWVRTLLPDQTASTRMPTLGGGTYVVLYEGRGIVEFDGARVMQDRPGRLLVSAPRNQVMTLRIVMTNSSDPVRNIRVVPKEYETTYLEHVFHPEFLKHLARFSVVRFADWAKARTSPLRYWYQRSRFDYARQTGPKGVAFEYMIMLANELRADPWISVPYSANKEVIHKLAELLRDNLEPDLQVYIEYADEPWRPGREVFQYCRREGQTMGLDDNPKKAGLKYQAFRSRQIFRMFGEVFGGQDRLVRVMSGPIDDLSGLKTLLEWEGIHDKVDRLGIAPYLDMSETIRLAEDAPLSHLFDRLELGGIPKLMSKIRAVQERTKGYGIELISYEGGVYAPGHRPRAQTLTRMSRHARMKEVLTDVLEGWVTNGGELFVHGPLIAPPETSQWRAALEYQDQDLGQAPKFDALRAFIEKRPRWWTRSKR